MLWKYLWSGPYSDIDSFKDYLKKLNPESGATIGFTVIDKPSNKKIGVITYLNIVPSNRTIEIGGIWYSPPFHGTYANTESSYLLINHAFEVLNYRRVEWKCGTNSMID